MQELLDIETRIIQLSHNISISAHSASEPKADRASTHVLDVNFAVHVEDEIRLKKAIDMIEKANKWWGLPPIIV